MKTVEVPAPAKINLALAVGKLRNDGYHEMEMIMQSLALHDRVFLRKTGREIKLKTSSDKLPEDRNNIAYRAAELILKKYNIDGGIEIYIEKEIPLAAGLAGGSSDAAAVLKGLNCICRLQISEKQLRNHAAKLGSDVPFCLRGGTVYASGRGEKLKQLPDLKRKYIILIVPPVEVSTAEIFARFERKRSVLNIPQIAPHRLARTLGEKGVLDRNKRWVNQLQPVTAEEVEDVNIIISLLNKFDVEPVLMSGSGPSVFGVVDNPVRCREIKKDWPRSQDRVFCTATTGRGFPELWP
uniref:4-(cytidine 5'-diphospho)-2-C-methyl-D-erythritol kinase n=1 Tax=uncultured organism TaxID=155900 RepID=M1PWJ1_9ZZZZ|nr:4-diphosphocytidyl-2C-methyl-D-erythritol kinase [uncultured organism]